MSTTFELTCDNSGQFYVDGKPINKRGYGHSLTADGKLRYCPEQNVMDRLAVAVERREVAAAEVAACRSHDERKKLWETVKLRRGIGGNHPIYLDPAEACAEAIGRLSPQQPVNTDGVWWGSTVCFTGQMVDREGAKITRAAVRLIANQVGFVWMPMVTRGCVFLVTGECNHLTAKTRKAVEYGAGILSPSEFWQLVGDVNSGEPER